MAIGELQRSTLALGCRPPGLHADAERNKATRSGATD